MKNDLEMLSNAVISGDEKTARKRAEEALQKKIDPIIAIKDGLMKGMERVGEKWEKLELFLPDVMLAADAMQAALAVLKPNILEGKLAELRLGTIVVGTILGDIHDIGKTLVAMMLEVAGFEVHDIGRDVPPERFIEKARESNADIIAVSTLMSPCIINIEDITTALVEIGERDKYLVIIGGAATSPEWAEKINADGYGRTAKDAVQVAKILMERGDSRRPVICE